MQNVSDITVRKYGTDFNCEINISGRSRSMKEKINDYEMSIRKTTKKSAKCSICGYRRPEMYLIHRHGDSYYMCRECVSYFLAIAALME